MWSMTLPTCSSCICRAAHASGEGTSGMTAHSPSCSMSRRPRAAFTVKISVPSSVVPVQRACVV
jgi:hypothetical protein